MAFHVFCFAVLLFISQSPIFIFTTSSSKDEADVMNRLASMLQPTPLGWNTSNHCTWPGIRCDNSLKVNGIYLSNRLLSGTLPKDLNSLSALNHLYLDNNHLSGTFPSLANLGYLHIITLYSNNFTSIPDDAFAGLTNLLQLSLGNNPKLSSWTIPSQLASSPLLNYFNASRTNLGGTIPDFFGSLTTLQGVDLCYNHLSGSLPRSLARSSIDYLWLSDQTVGFSGPLDVLATMTLLRSVWLNGNKFTGPIPDLSNCTSIIELRLQDNLLTGIVPKSLMSLLALDYIDLHNNKLQGPVPVFETVTAIVGVATNNFCKVTLGACDQQVKALLEIAGAMGYPSDLADEWKGNNACNQWRFVKCDSSKKVTIINFSRQHFQGTISPYFGNLTSLQELHLNDNNLTGKIPESLTRLSQLKTLDLSNNNIFPPLPQFASRVNVTILGNPNLLLNSAARGPPGFGSGIKVSRSKQKTFVKKLLLILLGAFVTIICVVCICLQQYNKRKRMIKHKKETEQLENSQDVLRDSPIRFTYEVLKDATNNFDAQRRLGGGGFGSVFEGTLGDGTRIAVKKLDQFGQGKKEFLTEVQTIGHVHHLNLVKLVGFCAEKTYRLLVYEYMSNGSLDKWIFRNNSRMRLNWETKKKIILHIAKGLEYLHEDCMRRIAHLDVKPQNVLLDERFNAKLSDFGLAKLIDRDQSFVMTQMRGTRGYLAPEWLDRKITEKADVYSYGVVLLEIVFQRQNLESSLNEQSDERLIDIVREKVEASTLSDLLDKTSEDKQQNGEDVEKTIKLALWCLHTDPRRRPSMSTVVKILEGAMSMQFKISESDLLPSSKANTSEVMTLTSDSIFSEPR